LQLRIIEWPVRELIQWLFALDPIHSINPLERLNGEIKRRTDVVGIFPNEDTITHLIGALLLEQNDEWAVQRGRYRSLKRSRL
jgi:transposase-like protein